MSELVYDTGALIAAQRHNQRLWAIHKRALQRGVVPRVPTGVVVEAWRGQNYAMNQLLHGCTTEPLDHQAAQTSGELLATTTERISAVDATVAELALRLNCPVLTADPGDLTILADGANRKLAIITI